MPAKKISGWRKRETEKKTFPDSSSTRMVKVGEGLGFWGGSSSPQEERGRDTKSWEG